MTTTLDPAALEAAQRVLSVPRRNGAYRRNGRTYDGVTDVLKALGSPALVRWAAVTAAGLVLDDPEQYSTPEAAANGIYGERESVAKRGRAVHSHAETGAKVDPEFEGYARALASFKTNLRPETIHAEAIVYNEEHRYAGRLDEVAIFPDGEVWLLDYKTRKANKPAAVYDDNKLQATAYGHADYLVTAAGEQVPMPDVQHGRRCVEDGSMTPSDRYIAPEHRIPLPGRAVHVQGNDHDWIAQEVGEIVLAQTVADLDAARYERMRRVPTSEATTKRFTVEIDVTATGGHEARLATMLRTFHKPVTGWQIRGEEPING